MMSTMQERGGSTVRFSTSALPPSQRLPALRDLFDRAVQLEVDTDPGLAVEMTMCLSPGLRRAWMRSSLTATMCRPASMLADGDDTVCVMIKTGGHLSLSQQGQHATPSTGDAVLLVFREPATLRFVDATYLSVRVPLSSLSLAGDPAAAAGRHVGGDSEALSLLRAYLATLPERFTDPALGRLSALHVCDLITLAIGAVGDARQQASRRGVRAARLAAVQADLVHDAALTIDEAAARQRVSPRYVQMLFEEAGTTFSDFALAQRLDAARRLLTSPLHAGRSVAAIALDAGFGDLSHFNRRFKRRFAMTPSEMRAQALREDTSESSRHG